MVSAHFVREARRRAGLSQKELADRVNTTQPVVARWETGRSHPSMETVVGVVRACGLDLTMGLSLRNDHDLALIRKCQSFSPAERLANLVKAVRSINKMVEVAFE